MLSVKLVYQWVSQVVVRYPTPMLGKLLLFIVVGDTISESFCRQKWGEDISFTAIWQQKGQQP